MDSQTMELLQLQNYVLILDEVIDVVQPLNIKKSDISLLINNGSINILKDGKVIWNDKSYSGEFNTFKNMCINQTVIYFKDKMMLWLFPCEIFDYFKDAYILTYLFEGSHLKSYFDIYKARYEYYKIEDNKIVKGKYDDSKFKEKIKSLVNLYYGDLNNIGDKSNSLSATWYKDRKKSCEHKILKRNIYNYFRNIVNDTSGNCMYSVFGKFEDYYKGNGYAKGFVPLNCRATNNYADKKTLCYAVNVYENPMVYNWFAEQEVILNQDMFALSTLIQWVWRSAIRNNNSINLYIPSKRMRDLFENWIKNKVSRLNLLNAA